MKKILFILSALIVCFVALPEIKKAMRRIVFEESLRAIRQNTGISFVSSSNYQGMTAADVKALRAKTTSE